MSAPMMSHWENRGAKPHSRDTVARLCDVFSCTEQDLFGFGDGYYAKTRGASGAVRAEASSSYAPVVGNIAAGEPREAFEQEGEVHWVDPDVLSAHPDGFFLVVAGDSMDRVLPEGSFAFVAPGEVSSGDVAAVKVNGDDATIKRVRLVDGVVILEPESTNPSYRRRVIDAQDPDAPAVRLLGRVVWFAANI